MSEFIVEADGCRIEFGELNGLKYKNSELKIVLKPTESHRAIIKEAKVKKKQYKACIAEVKVNDINDCKSGLEKSEKILDKLSYYLAFVFSPDVFFQNFKCYSVGRSTKNIDTRPLRNMHVGRMDKGSYISPEGIQEFINRGFNKFLNEDFNERTGLRRVILWYNAGREFSYASPEITFASHFIALEILALYFANGKGSIHRSVF